MNALKLKKILAVAVAAVGLAAVAANVEITSVDQTPGSGKATVNYAVSGLSTKTDLAIKASANGKSTDTTITGVANGAGSVTIDYKTALGAAPNVAFSAVLTDPVTEGVQLWEDGPYWATCNVGASKPQDYGLYFWWGDTAGYAYVTNKFDKKMQWEGSSTRTGEIEFQHGNESTGKTYGLTDDELKAGGYLDSNTNLVSSHDAATVHLGAPWRMPTNAEVRKLVDYCTAVWTNNWNGTGINGRLVTGRGAFSSKSIFLPATGYGLRSKTEQVGLYGLYWSSAPHDEASYYAYDLQFRDEAFFAHCSYRSYGHAVRPVRSCAK